MRSIRKLRPAKIRSAARRRWFERRLAAVPLDPGGAVIELGTPYGGWQLPDGVVGGGWVCYCVGAGGDVSFDLELIRRYGARVRCLDPVEEFGDQALAEAGGDDRFTFVHAALATHDGPVRMQAHHEAASRSVSAAGLYDSERWVEAPGRTLASVMRELGDGHVDLLKLDVEGAEYELLPTLDLDALGVRVLAVQLHHTGTVAQARALIDRLRGGGFRLVARRPVVKLTFLRGDA